MKSLWRKEPHSRREIKIYKSKSQISFKGVIDKINKEFSPIPIFLSCIKHKTKFLQGLEQTTILVNKFSFIFYYHMKIDITTRVIIDKEINLVNKSQLHVEGFT